MSSEANLVYKLVPGQAPKVQRNPVSKNKTKTNKQKRTGKATYKEPDSKNLITRIVMIIILTTESQKTFETPKLGDS